MSGLREKGAWKAMPEGKYFREALASFTSEAAYAGAVRHLHDLGYSAGQIRERLLYPASVQQIEKVIDDYEAQKNSPEGDYVYVQDVDKYGKRSFRRVKNQ